MSPLSYSEIEEGMLCKTGKRSISFEAILPVESSGVILKLGDCFSHLDWQLTATLSKGCSYSDGCKLVIVRLFM